MKNHDISRHEEQFQRWSDRITSRYVFVMKDLNINGIGLIVSARDYPQESHWQKLATSIQELLEHQLPLRAQTHSDGFWTAKAFDVPFVEHLAVHPTSYQMMLVSPFHKNERQNLLSHLEDATSNFHKHASFYIGTDTYRCLFLRVSATASVDSCQKWCQEYFAERAESTTIDVILLYQISILSEQSGDQTSIVHRFVAVTRPGTVPFTSANGLTNSARPRAYVGQFAASDSRKFFAGSSLEHGDLYFFQQGDIYYRPKTLPDGTIYGEVKHVAHGIRTHIVFGSGNDTVIMSGKFPPSHRILLYSWRVLP